MKANPSPSRWTPRSASSMRNELSGACSKLANCTLAEARCGRGPGRAKPHRGALQRPGSERTASTRPESGWQVAAAVTMAPCTKFSSRAEQTEDCSLRHWWLHRKASRGEHPNHKLGPSWSRWQDHMLTQRSPGSGLRRHDRWGSRTCQQKRSSDSEASRHSHNSSSSWSTTDVWCAQDPYNLKLVGIACQLEPSVASPS
jgi:hypothetical protein